MHDSPSTVFILNLLPHYRSGVFSAMIEQWDNKIVIAGGSEVGRARGIMPLDHGHIPTIRLRNRHLGPFTWQSGVFRTLLKYRAGGVVVFTGDWKILSTWFAALLARRLGLRVAFWTIGWHRANEPLVSRVLRHAFYRLSDGLLVYGRRAHEIGTSHGFAPSFIHVVGNSHSLPHGVPVASPMPEARDHIIYVGRLTPVKGIDLLLRAVSLIPAERRPHLHILGDGSELPRLRSIADSLGLSVSFAGAVHDAATLAQAYSRARVTVIPGAAGLTVTQSLAYGVPVITHGDLDAQMPEVEGIIPGETGELVAARTAEAFASEICNWFGLSPTEYSRRSAACSSVFLQGWTPEIHARRIIHAVQEIHEPSLM